MRFFIGRTIPPLGSATVVVSLLIGLFASAPSLAQSLAAAAIASTFQSVSITPSQSPKPFARIDTQEGTANFSGYSLQELIKDAYGLNDRQIAGGPDWVASAKYDIKAKTLGGNVFTFDEMNKCIQALLASQFNLVFHREKRLLPIYELVVAADGLKLEGPQFGDLHQSRILFTSGHVDARGVNMSAFAQNLAIPTGSVVVDKTGIAGSYDFSVDWIPSQNSAASISEALEQQLGLHLNPTTGPVELFVIDRVEKPHSQ